MKKETKAETKDWKKMLVDLEKKLDEFSNKKAPKLPESVCNFLVKYGPYFTMAGVIITTLMLLVSFGLLATILPLARMGYYGYGYNYGFSFWSLLGIVPLILQGAAVPGLFKRTKSAWNLMFYASLLNAFLNIFNGGLISAAISAVISWYFLFQIRRFYK